MRTVTKTLLATLATSALMMSANAAVSYGSAAAGQPYVGVKVGQIDVDAPKDATAYGIYGGYNFDQNLGAELEYVRSEDKNINVNGANLTYDAETYGAYATYRYHFQSTPFYAKGKLGLAKTDVQIKAPGFSSSRDKTSLAGGVGIGFKPTQNVGIEASYSFLNSDANMLGVGAHLAF